MLESSRHTTLTMVAVPGFEKTAQVLRAFDWGGNVDWFVLICSGFMESAGAIALGKSEGFSNMTPNAVFFVCLVLSMAGLGCAAKTLPIGVAYAAWTGIGVVAASVSSTNSCNTAAARTSTSLVKLAHIAAARARENFPRSRFP